MFLICAHCLREASADHSERDFDTSSDSSAPTDFGFDSRSRSCSTTASFCGSLSPLPSPTFFKRSFESNGDIISKIVHSIIHQIEPIETIKIVNVVKYVQVSAPRPSLVDCTTQTAFIVPAAVVRPSLVSSATMTDALLKTTTVECAVMTDAIPSQFVVRAALVDCEVMTDSLPTTIFKAALVDCQVMTDVEQAPFATATVAPVDIVIAIDIEVTAKEETTSTDIILAHIESVLLGTKTETTPLNVLTQLFLAELDEIADAFPMVETAVDVETTDSPIAMIKSAVPFVAIALVTSSPKKSKIDERKSSLCKAKATAESISIKSRVASRKSRR